MKVPEFYGLKTEVSRASATNRGRAARVSLGRVSEPAVGRTGGTAHLSPETQRLLTRLDMIHFGLICLIALCMWVLVVRNSPLWLGALLVTVPIALPVVLALVRSMVRTFDSRTR